MKKLLTLILALALALSLAACGESAADEDAAAGGDATTGEDTALVMGDNEIADLLNEGYACVMSTAEEGKWQGIFQMEESYDTVYKVVAAMSAEEYAAYDAISFDDEEAEAKQNAVLTTLTDVTVTDITSMLPTQEELDAYVGKTLGDLEDDGFENTGNSNYEGVYSFYYDGPVYCCMVDLEEGTLIEDMDDYSANDLRELKIGKVEFMCLSSYILDD